jgi:hypothetical protein
LSSCTGGPGWVTRRGGTRCEKPGGARCPRRAGRLRSWRIETLRGGQASAAERRKRMPRGGGSDQGPGEEARGGSGQRQDAQASGGRSPWEDRAHANAAATLRPWVFGFGRGQKPGSRACSAVGPVCSSRTGRKRQATAVRGGVAERRSHLGRGLNLRRGQSRGRQSGERDGQGRERGKKRHGAAKARRRSVGGQGKPAGCS